MPFKKNNKDRIMPAGGISLDREAIAFKGRMGQKEKLKLVPNWQEQLRDFVDELIKGIEIED